MGTTCGLRRQVMSHSTSSQFRITSRTALPLFPEGGSQSSPHPFGHPFQHRRRLAEAEVTLPSLQIGLEFLDLLLVDSFRPPRQFPHSPLEPQNRLRSNTSPRLPFRGKAEAQKLPLLRSRHRALPCIDPELQALTQKACDTCHHPFSRCPAAHVD